MGVKEKRQREAVFFDDLLLRRLKGNYLNTPASKNLNASRSSCETKAVEVVGADVRVEEAANCNLAAVGSVAPTTTPLDAEGTRIRSRRITARTATIITTQIPAPTSFP